jgi:hypothetical protein
MSHAALRLLCAPLLMLGCVTIVACLVFLLMGGIYDLCIGAMIFVCYVLRGRSPWVPSGVQVCQYLEGCYEFGY